MNKQIEKKIIDWFINEGKPDGMGRIPDNYCVNCHKDKRFARDVFKTLQAAWVEKMKRGTGFTIGCEWRGPSNHGTSDMAHVMSDYDLLSCIVGE